jgi:serine/threonine-protein kinase
MGSPTGPVTLTIEQVDELNKKLSTLRHDINGDLALVVASAVALIAVAAVSAALATRSSERGGPASPEPAVPSVAAVEPSAVTVGHTPASMERATDAEAPATPSTSEPRGPEPSSRKRHADSASKKRPASAPPEKVAGTGTLAFRIRPWAEIFVDGRSLGITPIAPVDLPAGRHHVLLRNKDIGKERAITTTVPRGETTTLRIDLLE